MQKAFFLAVFLSCSLWASPEVWLVAEHHHSSNYRQAFNQILQSQLQMDCVYLEDSPEMDAAAQAFLSGQGSFADTYMARFYEVNRRMNYKDDEIKKFWDSNYSGREAILQTAKDRNLKVFHVDYSSEESAGTVRVSGNNSTIEWNYIRRHEIMTRNMAAQRDHCQESMYLVGESHLDPGRFVSMQEQRSLATAADPEDCFKYTGVPLRPLGSHLEAAGFKTNSINVIFGETPRATPQIINIEGLSPERLRSLQEDEFRYSSPYYLYERIPARLSDFDQVFYY